jgi:hypothetical protein
MYKTEDAEADIENLNIVAIERRWRHTILILREDTYDVYVRCTIEKHNEFLARFRKKLNGR